MGVNEEEDEIGRVFFINLLKDWLEFDINDRTKFDATMASGITLLASQKKIKPKTEIKQTQSFVRKYSNTGVMSKLIK